MEELIGQIFTVGLTIPIIIGLIQLLIVFFISGSIKEWATGVIKRRLAYRRLKMNKYLNAGSWVRLPTSTGSVVAQIDRIREGYDVGLDDYSIKKKDDEGNPTLIQGDYADNASFQVSMPHSWVYDIKKTLADLRATPVVFIGYREQQETIIYGWYVSFRATVNTTRRAYYRIQVEELN